MINLCLKNVESMPTGSDRQLNREHWSICTGNTGNRSFAEISRLEDQAAFHHRV